MEIVVTLFIVAMVGIGVYRFITRKKKVDTGGLPGYHPGPKPGNPPTQEP